MPRGKGVQIENTSLYWAVKEDNIFSSEQKEQIYNSKTQKELFQYVATVCNEILNKGRNDELLNKFESFLNNTGCGVITKERMSIERRDLQTKNHCYYYSPEIEYEDPDAISYHLYMKMAMILNSRKKDVSQIKNCTVGVTNDYFFCLKIEYDSDKKIELSGDWVTDWDLISECGPEEESKYCSAMNAHSIAGHVFWPCKRESARTINLIRKNYSIQDTLKDLKLCYDNEFILNESLEGNKELMNAFIDNKEWFNLFKFKQYVDFFSLSVFLEEGLTSDNINKKMLLRFNELLSLKS